VIAHRSRPIRPRSVVAIALGLALGFGSCARAQKPVQAGAQSVLNVRAFGAKGDGRALDTAAIQKALDQCGRNGGTVAFPPGTYLSQPLTVGTRTTLVLEEGATLKATDEPKDYLPATVSWQDILDGKSKGPFQPFIGGKDLIDVTIRGKGIIDGSGARWWIPAEEARRKVSGYTLPRPNLIVLTRVKNFQVRDVTIQNSPKFHLVPTECQDVVISNVTVLSPPGAANTDAIDPSLSRRVLITKCLIDVGDDNIAIKSGRKVEGREFACEDITVTDCVFKHGHGMSIGSETVGGVRNVTVRNCKFEGTENGIRIKSPRGRGGAVENLICENITMEKVEPAITITCYYPHIPEEDGAQPVTAETPAFRNIRIANLTATCLDEAGVIVGLPESRITGVVLENIRITAASGLLIRNAKGVQLKNVQVNVKQGESIRVKDAEVEGLPGAKAGK
jgi:polygalacturonase